MVTVVQFRENLTDRQAAEAVRSRIDVKYLLGLELTDSGFDFSVLSEFRSRSLEGKAEALLLEKLLSICRELELVKARGKQRTDATRVLAAIREMNRLEQVAETMRAALNELAVEPPIWLQSIVPAEWYKRYGRRIEDERLLQSKTGREAYAQTVGEDGFHLLELVIQPDAPVGLDKLPKIAALRLVWERHYERKGQKVRFKGLPPGEHLVDSAYVDADLLVKSLEEQGIIMVGPTRKNPAWQARTEGAYDHYQFDIDWKNERIRCPQGKVSKSWYRFATGGKPYSKVLLRDEDCNPCQARHLCTKGKKKVHILPPQAQYEALREQRRIHASEGGKKLYNKRAGVEGL